MTIDAPGVYVYRQTLDLTGFDLSTVTLSGSFAIDDASGRIQLNGVTVGPTSLTFASTTAFSLTSGFVAGRNTLDFVVTNGPTGGIYNPTGLFVEQSGTGTLLATGTRILPQFVFGGGWYTALYFTNTTSTPVSFGINFVSDDGNPFFVPAVGGSSATVNLAARGTVVIEALNSGPLNHGYATASLPSGVVGYGVFRQTISGFPDQEAVDSGDLVTRNRTVVTVFSEVMRNPSSFPSSDTCRIKSDGRNKMRRLAIRCGCCVTQHARERLGRSLMSSPR